MTARSFARRGVPGAWRWIAVVLAAALAGCSSAPHVARSAASGPQQSPPAEEVLASLDTVPESELETVRGGFEGLENLDIWFALRTVTRIAGPGGDVTESITDSGRLSPQEFRSFVNNLRQDLAVGGTAVSQSGLQTLLLNTTNNAAIDRVQELTITIDNFGARARSLRRALSASEIMGRIQSLDLPR